MKVKRIFAVILAFLLVFSMCGCEELEKLEDIELPPLPTAEPETTDESSIEDVDEPDENAEPAAHTEKLANHVIVSVNNTVLREYDPANGTELILSFAYETPTVYVEGRDDASKKINEYLAMLDETYYTGNDYGAGTATGYNMMLELALDNYGYVIGTGAENVTLEFTSYRTVTVPRAGEGVLSLLYNESVYTGGAGEANFNRAYVFDTETGEELSLEQLAEDYESLSNFLTDYMVSEAENNSQLAQHIDETSVPADSRSDVFAALLREGSWYLSTDGLVIFSDINEFGPGNIEFVIDYSELKGRINDKWIPAEKEAVGSFELKLQEDVADGSMEIIDKLIVDTDGEELCLIVKGTVYEVNLASVEYMDKFFETAQHWHCSYMSDCALQLVTNIPDGMPNLMVSYRSADGVEHSLLITQSGKDGTIMLSDDSIEAVG